MEKQYHSSSHCKYLTQYHIIWCPKFRFSILKNGYDNTNAMISLGAPLFTDVNTQNRFNDYSPYVVGKGGVKNAIDFMHSQISDYFKSLTLSDDEYKEWKKTHPCIGTQKDRIKNEIMGKMEEWEDIEFPPYSLNPDQPLVTSWLYEYEIFQLVELYRETDWEKNTTIFFGH